MYFQNDTIPLMTKSLVCRIGPNQKRNLASAKSLQAKKRVGTSLCFLLLEIESPTFNATGGIVRRPSFDFDFTDKPDRPSSWRQKDDGVEDLTEDVDSGTDDAGGSNDFVGLHKMAEAYNNKKEYATQNDLSDAFDKKDKQHIWKDRALDSVAR